MYLNRTEKRQGAQNIQKQRYKYINKQKRKKRAKKKKDCTNESLSLSSVVLIETLPYESECINTVRLCGSFAALLSELLL